MQQIFGKKSVLDQIKYRKNELKCVHFLLHNKELLNLCKQNNIPYKIEDKRYFLQFPKKLNHQNVVGDIVSNINEPLPLNKFLESNIKTQQLILVLDSIEDPFNFGAILRSAASFGIDAVIYKKNNQVQINDFVTKTSLGATHHLKLFRVPNLSNAINVLKQHKFWVYASVLTPEASLLQETKFDKRSVLIVGNENKGVSPLLVKEADFKISIPMFGNMQSLNVSVATGIMLYQIKISQNND